MGMGFTWHQVTFNQPRPASLRYAIDRDTDLDQIFDIDADTGAIVTGKGLDRETAGWHNITVLAMEAGKLRGGVRRGQGKGGGAGLRGHPGGRTRQSWGREAKAHGHGHRSWKHPEPNGQGLAFLPQHSLSTHCIPDPVVKAEGCSPD